MNVKQYYQNALAKYGYQTDSDQLKAVDRLQQAWDEWRAYKDRRSNSFKRLIIHPKLPRGLYLWGGVGRGKSFLMDSFYNVVPVTRKERFHFHEFMRLVHSQIDELKGMADPLDQVALRIAKKYRLICFDEFHISDIADAMILYNLLRVLFENGVTFIMTSNYAPNELYPDGLHRDRLLPAIALLGEKLDVMNIDAGIDYRQRTLDQVDVYLTPLGAATNSSLRTAFKKLAQQNEESPIINIECRKLRALRRSGDVIWFDFATICGGPRSQNDYLEIAQRFRTVIISDIPVMTPAMASEARRFTWLIDVFYDQRTKLIISAAVAPELLYTEGVFTNEFQRTVSRIVEMRSREYLEAPPRSLKQNL